MLHIHLIHIVAFHMGNTLFYFFFNNVFHPKIPSWFGQLPRYSLATLHIRPVKGSNREFHAVLGCLSIQTHLQVGASPAREPHGCDCLAHTSPVSARNPTPVPSSFPREQALLSPSIYKREIINLYMGRTRWGITGSWSWGIHPINLQFDHKHAQNQSTRFQFCISLHRYVHTFNFFFSSLHLG